MTLGLVAQQVWRNLAPLEDDRFGTPRPQRKAVNLRRTSAAAIGDYSVLLMRLSRLA